LADGALDFTEYQLLHDDIQDLLSRRAEWLNKRNETRPVDLQPFPQDLDTDEHLNGIDVYGKSSRVPVVVVLAINAGPEQAVGSRGG
jgi:hypothetical protein